MQIDSAGWVLFGLALVLANAPFLLTKLLGFIVLSGGKTLAWILLEWLLAYALFIAVGVLMENALGQVQAQGWEFYAITSCLFVTLAFPGFVWRFLWRR